MAQLAGGPINTQDVVRSVPEGKPVPPGIYQGIVVKTEQKETNDRTGVRLEVEFDITWPSEYKGRKFWDSFNLVNQSAEAVRISKEALADLGAAALIPTLNDEEQLRGREVIAELRIEEGNEYTDKYGNKKIGKDKNKCVKYWPLGTDVESASKAHREQQKAKQSNAPAPQYQNQATPAGDQQSRFPGSNAAPQPQYQQQPQQQQYSPPPAQSAPAAPATNVAPWRRNGR